MATKHTLGPWLIDPSWDILGNTKDGNGMVCQITVDAVPRDEAAANAHLIAAAPDMYEALKDCAEILFHLRMSGKTTSQDEEIDAIRESALEAIAKAEGRS